MTLSTTSIFMYYVIHFIFFSKNKMSLITGVYGHVDHQILHEEEKNRRRSTALEYDTNEDKLILYHTLYVKHLEEHTKNTVAKRTQH